MTDPDFVNFYKAVHGYEPYPWQCRLAACALSGQLPTALDLPTASGKTSTLDALVYALAQQADLPLAERTIGRRLVYVIDRRLIVDQVSEHAEKLAAALRSAHTGPVAAVAQGLRRLAGSSADQPPLQVVPLRGGMYRDEAWSDDPARPVVIVATIDQVGSRLLYRGYGLSPFQWPIQAGLLGNDVTYIIDEAHLAQPFSATLHAVADLRQQASTPLLTPFAVLTMTATPPDANGTVLRLETADHEHPALAPRLRARKPTTLLETKTLVKTLVTAAQELPGAVIGIVVNRVATARAVFETLRQHDTAILLTGRIRPYDRDRLLTTWLPRIRAGRVPEPAGRVYVVATQTIEVGADVDFDALVTEAAPLSALRQRFGRLNRTGRAGDSLAVIVCDTTQDDPVYGKPARSAFQWLKKQTSKKMPQVDMGILALDVSNPPPEPPPPATPILAASHLDLLVQTAPAPALDVAPYLHGVQDTQPEVQVIWRADLDADAPERWADTVALMPPSGREALALPLSACRAWLAHQTDADAADLEGRGIGAERRTERRPVQVLRWDGADSKTIDSKDIRPGYTLIVPCQQGGVDAFGWHPALRQTATDLAELCQDERRAGRLRLHPDVISPATLTGLKAALAAESETDLLSETARAAVVMLSQELPPDDPLQTLLTFFATAPFRLSLYPVAEPEETPAGVVLSSRTPLVYDDGDDALSHTCPVPLTAHLDGVGAQAEQLSRRCGLPATLTTVMGWAGRLHDLGKSEWRFQVMLHGGDAIAASRGRLLAKSGMDAADRAGRRRVWTQAGLPQGWRHELVSVALADTQPPPTDDPALVRHLIGTHHGRARPLAPIVVDPQADTVKVDYAGLSYAAGSAHGLERLESGWLEQFWVLVRRYGYWGLAYLETLLRLADRAQSKAEVDDAQS